MYGKDNLHSGGHNVVGKIRFDLAFGVIFVPVAVIEAEAAAQEQWDNRAKTEADVLGVSLTHSEGDCNEVQILQEEEQVKMTGMSCVVRNGEGFFGDQAGWAAIAVIVAPRDGKA